MPEIAPPPAADRIVQNCVAVRIRLLNRAISNLYDEALRPYGITVAQLNMLVIVSRLGEATPRDIGRLLVMEKSTVSRNVERMRANNWIEVRMAADNRSQRISLTPEGQTALREACQGWEEAQRRAASIFGEDGLTLLGSVCNQVSGQDAYY